MTTRGEWVTAFLAAGGWPDVTANRVAVHAWGASETGTEAPWPCSYNLLDTTLVAGGSTPCNDAGVQSYADLTAGVHATVATLAGDAAGYAEIRAALAAGDDAETTCAAVAGSAWGSHPTAANIDDVRGDLAAFEDLLLVEDDTVDQAAIDQIVERTVAGVSGDSDVRLNGLNLRLIDLEAKVAGIAAKLDAAPAAP